ncbi:uncharacterized protein NPIL_211461 [Nephila pilipes]|uniref:WAP domain-containing protein n=1 Tax=Nephila pilipes TaxID=299642 RepID=A0A8X6ITU2_NEPPI|nr:uncharacterized protein NPIL_211461 [Nephila pilipes]
MEHISMKDNNGEDFIENSLSSQNKILNGTVEWNNISEHLNPTRSIFTNFSDISVINSSDSIKGATQENEIIQDRDPVKNSKTSDAFDVESNSISRNISESELKTENALDSIPINQTLSNASKEQDFRNSSTVLFDSSPNVSRNENASNFIADINKTISMQNHSIDLNEILLDHKGHFNDSNTNNSFLLNFLTNETSPQDLDNFVNVSEKLINKVPIVEQSNEGQNSGGILSGIGLNFLISSEVARNAVKAMEVFNFTDPLTDHIFEENEFHSFLDTKLPMSDVDSDSPHLALNQSQTEAFHYNSTEIFGNSTFTNNRTLLQPGSETSFNTTDLFKRNLTLLELDVNERNGTVEELNFTKNNETLLSLTDALAENETLLNLTLTMAVNETMKLLNLSEVMVGNETLMLLNRTQILTKNETKFNITRGAEEKTLDQLNEESAGDFISKNETVTVLSSIQKGSESNPADAPKCPPPGFCILWFWSQDACQVDNHCLGSRICCRVRCSKTCIDIETL